MSYRQILRNGFGFSILAVAHRFSFPRPPPAASRA